MTTAAPFSGLSARVPERLFLWGAVAAAWVAIVAADATGLAGALHHHSLIENGLPLPIAVGLFLVGWQVMVAAMMLPASSATIGAHAVGAGSGRFVAAYLIAWSVFGLACFGGDAVIHRLVDMTPWLADNTWLIPTLSLAGAGLYQFAPIKRRFTDACRVPAPGHEGHGLARAGLAHARDCIGASGPLMLLMFAAGFASLAWMVALAALMFYEVRGRHAQTAIRASGVVLLWLALLATMGGVPGWVTP